ncbi:MAG: aminoacyl-tRNA hydrolase [Clostridiales bacterium]|nr:aminoacyl-tRNA hydrolase [Clostridiales bacterium]
MYIVVGLGNPGPQYARTRHNAGFDVVEILADRLGARLNKLQSRALTGEARLGGEKIILAQPQTFMNLSGESVVRLVEFYKIELSRLVLCYDDVDLDMGAVRVRAGGSAGTHNGMRSVIYQLQRDDFPRVRVGIGKPSQGWELADYVLSRYHTAADRQAAFDAYLAAAHAIEALISRGVPAASEVAAAHNAAMKDKA